MSCFWAAHIRSRSPPFIFISACLLPCTSGTHSLRSSVLWAGGFTPCSWMELLTFHGATQPALPLSPAPEEPAPQSSWPAQVLPSRCFCNARFPSELLVYSTFKGTFQQRSGSPLNNAEFSKNGWLQRLHKIHMDQRELDPNWLPGFASRANTCVKGCFMLAKKFLSRFLEVSGV